MFSFFKISILILNVIVLPLFDLLRVVDSRLRVEHVQLFLGVVQPVHQVVPTKTNIDLVLTKKISRTWYSYFLSFTSDFCDLYQTH